MSGLQGQLFCSSLSDRPAIFTELKENAWDQHCHYYSNRPHPKHDVILLLMSGKYTEEYCFLKSWGKSAHAQSLDTRPFSRGIREWPARPGSQALTGCP